MNKIFVSYAIFFLLFIASYNAIGNEQSFKEFWPNFRSTLLKEDYARLANMVKLPLKVRGVDDDTPAGHYTAEKLSDIIPAVLEQVVYVDKGDDLVEKKLRDVIQEKNIVAADASENTQRVEQFEFEKIKGSWLLVRVYLE